MLAGSKRNSAGALAGLVPDFSPHRRMKLLDSRVRSVAHWTSPVVRQRPGLIAVFTAAKACCCTATGTAAATSAARTTHAESTARRQSLVRDVIESPHRKGGHMNAAAARPVR